MLARERRFETAERARARACEGAPGRAIPRLGTLNVPRAWVAGSQSQLQLEGWTAVRDELLKRKVLASWGSGLAAATVPTPHQRRGREGRVGGGLSHACTVRVRLRWGRCASELGAEVCATTSLPTRCARDCWSTGAQDGFGAGRYAASGGERHRVPQDTSRADFDSPFEEEVARLLATHGYRVTPQVGVRGYSIDLGVSHPSFPHGFLCGVECDGALYHSAKSARERDRLREDILRNLGWQLVRVWSTDWYHDRQGTGRRLLEQLGRLTADS